MTLALSLLLWLLPATDARYLSGGAIETQPGFTAINGISPVPTEAPGLNGIPKELRNRAIQTFVASPPSNWCGFVDGDYQNLLRCAPNTPCLLKSDFFIECGCTSRNTDLCFTESATACVDFDIYDAVSTLRGLTVGCDKPSYPYCHTFTSSGLISLGCDSTSFAGTHSFVPVSAYYASYSKSTLINNPGTKISSSPISTPSNSDVPYRPVKSSKLSTAARAGIGIGAGLAILIAAAAIAFCLWQKRKRERASSPAGGAGPAMAQTNINPQVYQSAAQPAQQYQPQSDNTKFPEPGDIPPYSPAPVYTSGSHRMSTTPIPPYDQTNNPNSTSKYPSPTIAPASPLSPNPSHQTHQQQNTAPSWDYPPASPISTLGPGVGPNMHQPETPLNHPELGVGEAGVPRTGSPWNHSELGVGAYHTSPPGNHSALGTAVHHPNPPEHTSPPGNHSELGTAVHHPNPPEHTSPPGNHSELGTAVHHPNPPEHTSPPGNHSELGTAVHHPNPPENYSELPGAGTAGAYYPHPPKNHSELGP